MNKQEFVEGLAKKAKLSRKDAKVVVETTLQLIVDSVKKGDKVRLTGFGTFEPYRRKAGKRINPQTGTPIQVPAKTVPKFRAGKQLKAALARRK
jgi:DNA-binding protein HU-beta